MYELLAKIISKSYNILFSLLDSFILKGNIENYEYYKKGYEVLELQKNLDFNFDEESNITVNKYLEKIIFTQKQIEGLIDQIFIKNNFKYIISKMTGFNYSIDYFVAYQTKSIDESDIDKAWYANHWHKDKPFSKFFIKLIVPLEEIDEKKGGIQIVSVNKSKEKIAKVTDADFKMICKRNEILIFSPNLCFHQAGRPATGKDRKQIMFQLNPSKKWEYNNELFLLQKKKEPKFPFFSYFFYKKKEI
tara:strand:- start:423 stop:1163 length:741 start_codon:yes stop_codon:yes gene_type:complete